MNAIVVDFENLFPTGSELAPTRFRTSSEAVPNRFRIVSDLVPNRFRTSSEPSPKHVRMFEIGTVSCVVDRGNSKLIPNRSRITTRTDSEFFLLLQGPLVLGILADLVPNSSERFGAQLGGRDF